MIVKPVCVACRCFYRAEHNGHFFTEMKPDNNPGRIYPEDYRGNKMPEV